MINFAFDLILFNLIADWEICSGGLRRRDIGIYMKLLKKYGWSTKEFKLYVDILKEYLDQNTGGFGIGVERLIGVIIDNNKIGELQPYPRTPQTKAYF